MIDDRQTSNARLGCQHPSKVLLLPQPAASFLQLQRLHLSPCLNPQGALRHRLLAAKPFWHPQAQLTTEQLAVPGALAKVSVRQRAEQTHSSNTDGVLCAMCAGAADYLEDFKHHEVLLCSL